MLGKFVIASAPCRRVSIVAAMLLVAALQTGRAREAVLTGTISGRVTSATTSLGLPNTVIRVYSEAEDDFVAFPTTDALGDYTVSLPNGNYALLTQNVQGYINEIHDNIPCSAVCDTSTIAPIVVTDGSSFTANFALDPGGRMAGTITDMATGLPIAGIRVNFVDPGDNVDFTSATTNALGQYLSDGGTVTGNVYAVTSNVLGYQNEAYNDVKCLGCNLTVDAMLIPVTIGVTNGPFDFALDIGGRITGNVKDASLTNLAGIAIEITNSAGNRVDFSRTDAAGNFVSGGLPSGTYYANTYSHLALFLVDRLWNNIMCAGGTCDPRQGTPIPVTLPNPAGNINFVLIPGGSITGTVTNAVGGAPVDGAFIGITDPAGTQVGGDNANDAGVFVTGAVPSGTYYANSLSALGFQNQLYSGVPCAPTGCPVLNGTPFTVTAGATTSNINFPLVPTTSVGTITGTVTNASTLGALSNLQVQLFNSAGQSISNVNTNGAGVYTFTNAASGSYYLRTNGGGATINQLYNGITCQQCPVTTSGGTLVAVTSGSTTTIDFALAPGGRISGTVTNASGGAGITGVGVQVFSATGVNMGTFTTAGVGGYITVALPDGTYYLRTTNSL